LITLKELLIPPGGLLVIAVVALMFRHRLPRTAGWGLTLSLASLYVLSTPIFGSLALQSMQPAFVEPTQRAQGVQAIVLLGGGSEGEAPEYGGDNVKPMTLVRLRYAAKLQRATGLPLLVSGGTVTDEQTSEAEQMRKALTEELNVPVRWIEPRSVDTFTNALESARILKAAGIERVFLVTHAWHIPRARLSFEHAGLQVVPAPTGFASYDWADMRLGHFLPRPSAFLNSYYFFHEAIGYVVYTLRARF